MDCLLGSYRREKSREKKAESQDHQNASLDNTRNDDGHNEERNETSNSTITEGPKQKSTRPKKRSKMNESDDFADNAISEHFYNNVQAIKYRKK
ncbi:unnamed protein product [Parnassius apollo]|uniref:(apollo) hypothetical protein n=1 Tax=Parnassius apollo TaxID=110799 RepID=A0A8S3XSN7_PARAO|nr:unnamed protein product [Parnassius apollo]